MAGDPIDGTRWTRKTTQSIAEELLTVGIEVSANTVGRLLRQMCFSLKTNRKHIESGVRHKRGDRARRNRQFLFINSKRRKFETADLPIISVDGKKRELIGCFKNAGRTWRRKPKEVYDHDFPSDAEGVALPYGIYPDFADSPSILTQDGPSMTANQALARVPGPEVAVVKTLVLVSVVAVSIMDTRHVPACHSPQEGRKRTHVLQRGGEQAPPGRARSAATRTVPRRDQLFPATRVA